MVETISSDCSVGRLECDNSDVAGGLDGLLGCVLKRGVGLRTVAVW